MNILDSQRKILEFCVVPRTSVEIEKMLGLQKTSVYILLRNLVFCKEIIKKGNSKNRVNPAVFIAISSTKTNEDMKIKANNFYAHNPFGL